MNTEQLGNKTHLNLTPYLPLLFPREGGRGVEFPSYSLELDSRLPLLLLLLEDLPDCSLREQDVVFLLKIGAEPALAESGFLTDLLE